MANQMQQKAVPLDFNNLGGADQNNYNNNYNNYNNMNTMNGYPRGSNMNDANNNYNPDFANQTQRMNNNNYSQSNFNNNYGMNQNYNMDNNNMNTNINSGMNDYVKKELSSHGLNLRSPSQIRLEEQERKKMLLNNIQSQINLTKKTKLEELRKRQEEDAKYLKDMVVCFPFGRGGGGAPIRDKSGNIVTTRRALISDPKYNLAQINVDDDYYDVWDKEKRIGRYYRTGSQTNINNFNNNYNNMNQQLSNTTQNFGNQNYFDNQNVGRPYSTNPRILNGNNYNNGQMMNNYYPQNNDMNNNYSNNQQFSNTLQRPTYDNFDALDKDQVRQVKANYRQDLLNQMKENENKKILEKKEKN